MVGIGPQEDQAIARLEELGEAQVRLLMSSGDWPSAWQQITLRWLAKKEAASRARSEVSQVEQDRTARSAKKAAWIAAIAAIVAAVIAIVSAVIAWIAWRWPHT
jgi:hypothetical protein